MNKVVKPDEAVAAAEAEFARLIAEHPGIAYVDAAIADSCGTLRGKRLAVSEADKMFACGMQIPVSLPLMDARGEMTNAGRHGFGDGDPDGTAWPIAGTVTPVWGADPARAQMLMRLCTADGAPVAYDARNVLERVATMFEPLGLTPVTALELEFYLIDLRRDAEGRPQPPLDPRSGRRESIVSVYGLDDLDRYQAFLSAVDAAAALQQVPVSAATKEYAPGQFETNLQHQKDPLRAADHAVFLRQIVKAAALACGFQATFMAKPYADRAGSGMHVHVSLLDREGRNVFDNGSVEGSDLLRFAAGGLAQLMPGSMALFAPTLNAYRRFAPDMFAPVNRRLGINNRSAGLRIPIGPDHARRVEHRCAGADANPYLVLAAVLAGVHHGLTQKCDPGTLAAGNVSRERDPALPASLEHALEKMRNSPALASYFGGETVALYCDNKQVEQRRVTAAITPAEYEWYL